MTRIKICGITNEKDALWAASLGADYLGFNFWRGTARKVSPQSAARIIAKLPPFLLPVAIFVDEDIKNILKIVKKCGFKIVQLHGEESPQYCSQLKTMCPVEIIKAFKIKNEDSLCRLDDYAVDYYLLDAWVPGMEGGTGETFNWEVALKARETGKRIFLAGGLNPENVEEAVRTVKPYAVDVASGVEKSVRKKDYQKMKDFLLHARRGGV